MTGAKGSAMEISPGSRADGLGRRERGKLEKRKKIVEAARHLFTTKGFDATTTSEIAELADIGSGTLFTYAKTKDDLLVMVFHDEILEVNKRAFERIPAEDELIDQLMYVFRQMIDYHGVNMELQRRISRLILDPTSQRHHSDMIEMLELIYGDLTTLLEDVARRGKIASTTDCATVARLIFSIYYMNLLLWLSGLHDQVACMNFLESELKVVTQGLRCG